MIGEKAGKGCMDNNLSKFDDLIQLMEKTPRVAPPADFTRKVMTRLSEEKIPAGRFSFWRMWRLPALAGNWAVDFRRPVARTECAFYFILTGFFLLAFSLFLMAGIVSLKMLLLSSRNIIYAPLLPLILGLMLIGIGAAFHRDNEFGILLARRGVKFFIGTLLIGSVVAHMLLPFQLSLFLVWPSGAAGLAMGLLLVRAVRQQTESLESTAMGV